MHVCHVDLGGGCNVDMLSTVRITFRGLTKNPFAPRLPIYWNVGTCMVRSDHWASDLNRRDHWDLWDLRDRIKLDGWNAACRHHVVLASCGYSKK